MLPTLETGRLALRQRALADLPECLAMDRDPEVTRYIEGPWTDPVAHEAFVRERIARWPGPDFGYWTVIPRTGLSCVLGWIMLLPTSSPHSAELGWRFARAAWGMGYATEAALAVIAHARRIGTVRSLIADIDTRNTASRRVAHKLGMRPDSAHGTRGEQRFELSLDDIRAH
ncbi:GNAT family N-acetyltransferase [Paludibacterium paludis]|uniref:N-acetyltransferase n=1 Tax=Paludibacterium paludis TaxID=1225769 RepID=A0A918U9L6_9NEIS|nr:GNAT family N-acetyltransferase [Paludibacterium paludis]GGY13945.1 N-acetyltransferase [Paludibacterium paludis]